MTDTVRAVLALDDPRMDVAGRALQRAGARRGKPVVIRHGHSLLVRRGDVVVRVRPRSAEPVAAREVAVAEVLDQAGVPITRLARGDGQPWIDGGFVVTAWAWTEAAGVAGPAELGALARMLRTRTVGGPAYDVPRFDPIGWARRSVGHLTIGDEQGDVVRRMAHDLSDRWALVADHDPDGVAVVHGDLHRDNVVAARRGPVLTDLEQAGSGPPSYDAAPSLVAVRRYGADPSTFEAFVVASGRDPREWDGFETCVAAYELGVTAWAVGVRDRSPELAAEAALRVRALTVGDDRPWHLH